MKVACLDVTPGGLAASCDTDGNLLVWTTDNGEPRVMILVLSCHIYAFFSVPFLYDIYGFLFF